MILTDGRMGDFSNNWSNFVTKTGCIFSLLLTTVFTANQQISVVVGSSVTLRCNNESHGDPTGVTWKKNKSTILKYNLRQDTGVWTNSSWDKTNTSNERHLLAIHFHGVQKSDTGIYECEVTTNKGFWEISHELTVEDKPEEKLFSVLPIYAVVPCVCVLIIICTWILLIKSYKSHKLKKAASSAKETDDESVYENYLEGEKRINALREKK